MKVVIDRIKFRIAVAKKDSTLSKVAEEIGLSKGHLSVIVNGKRTTPEIVELIAENLKVPTKDILRS